MTICIKTQCLSLAIAVLALTQISVGQDDSASKGIQIKPSAVVQETDEKTLMDKVSKLIGFRFMSSVMQNPKANMDEVVRGMQAAANGEDMTSFIAGYQMMQRMKENGADLKMEQCLTGMKMANEGKVLDISEEEAQMLQSSFMQRMEKMRRDKLRKEAEENVAAGEAYVKAQREKNPNLKELENGMYYEVLAEGKGESPAVSDSVKIHYTGRFIDGEIFDSSRKKDGSGEPAQFPVSRVVPGFSKTLQSMKQGSKWVVYIPGTMAYGMQGSGKIGPNQMLVFEIELLEIIK